MISVSAKDWMKETGKLVGVSGRVTATVNASVGELVQIHTGAEQPVLAEVIGFDHDSVQVMPFQRDAEFRRGNAVVATGKRMRVPVGFELLGRVINARCQPLDGKGSLGCRLTTDLTLSSPDPLLRPHIREPFVTGIRAIDGLLTIGQGQRVGLFAGSGVGKSTLLGEIARHAESDVNVVAMIGERGREVRPFIEENLGKDGLRKSIVIVSTSDQPPLARIRACEIAVVIADWFRATGKNVLLMIDSMTRLSHAQRELGLLLGEPPTSRGYTPSVFQKMALLLEQLGTSETGSITGLITILVDADDMNDPVADAARSILDGHIVLDRKLASQGHFPAINVLDSASRLFNSVASPEQKEHAANTRRVLAKYSEVEDLLQIGAYKRGAVPESDLAVDKFPIVTQFLRQSLGSSSEFANTMSDLAQLNQIIGAA